MASPLLITKLYIPHAVSSPKITRRAGAQSSPGPLEGDHQGRPYVAVNFRP